MKVVLSIVFISRIAHFQHLCVLCVNGFLSRKMAIETLLCAVLISQFIYSESTETKR